MLYEAIDGNKEGSLFDLTQDRMWMKEFSAKVLAESVVMLATYKPEGEINVTPDSLYCTVVNGLAATLLEAKGFNVEYLEHERERGSVAHAFIRSESSRSNILLDLQYKQFVPKDLREDLPDELIITYLSKQDVVNGLESHRIPVEYHSYWLEELFWNK